MQLTGLKREVTRSGTGTESSFGMVMNGKAFRILSDTIYKDKIGSIVREVSCNAADSHVEAGKADVPFTIHAPDDFEPWFSVRDYGVGMDDNSVRKIFTTYFSSTKDDSNKCVGAFGLGSKTPFAYADSFTITAIKDGVKRVYAAFLNEEGIPTITDTSVTETDECNGVEITIPVVDPNDCIQFTNAIRTQLNYLKVKPEVTNALVEFTDPYAGASYKGDGYAFGIKGGYGITIVQGGVGYRLDMNLFNSHLGSIRDQKEVKDFIAAVAHQGAVIDFPIGSIDVIASREAVEYTKRTMEGIFKRFCEIYEAAAKNVKDFLDSAATEWDRRAFLAGNRIIFSLAVKAGLVPAELSYKTGDLTGLAGVESVQTYNVGRGRYNHGNIVMNSGTSNWIRPGAQTVIFVNDRPVGRIARIREYCDDHTNTSDGVATNVVVVTLEKNSVKNAKSILKNVSKILGDAPVLMVSDYSYTKRAKGVVAGKILAYALDIKPRDYVGSRITGSNHTSIEAIRVSDVEEVDEIADHPYVVFDTVDKAVNDALLRKYVALNYAVNNQPRSRVYAIRDKVFESIKDEYNGVRLEDAIAELEKDYSSNNSDLATYIDLKVKIACHREALRKTYRFFEGGSNLDIVLAGIAWVRDKFSGCLPDVHAKAFDEFEGLAKTLEDHCAGKDWSQMENALSWGGVTVNANGSQGARTLGPATEAFVNYIESIPFKWLHNSVVHSTDWTRFGKGVTYLPIVDAWKEYFALLKAAGA